MKSIRLINCFEVAAHKEDDFLRLWRQVNDYMRGKPGYVSHRLHRSLDPDARYRFINYVEWDSEERLEAARDEGFRALVTQPGWREITSTRANYEILDEVGK